MAAPHPPFLIGIDGGGTGCRVAIADANGLVVAQSGGGPANYTSDPDATIANVLRALEAARVSGKLDEQHIATASAHLGLAGVLQNTDLAQIISRMPMENVTVSDDRLTSLVGALAAHDGVLVSVGTGSFIAIQRGAKRSYLGGWGLNVGDQASGAWLGRRLLELCVLVSDGLEDHSDLAHDVLVSFEADPTRITQFARTANPSDYAGYAPQIVGAAQARDAHAMALLQDGASYLNACLHRAGLGEGDMLCLMGSLGAHYAPYLDGRFQTHVAEPLGTALDGAISLARHAATSGR